MAITFMAGNRQARPKLPSAPPAILIYWEAGRKVIPISDELSVAIWQNGQAIWRDPAPVYGQSNHGHWGLNKATFKEVQLDPAAVHRALESLSAANVFNVKDWGYWLVDGDGTHEIVSYLGKSVDLGSSGEPALASADMPDAKRDMGTRAWRLIRSEVKALVANRGTVAPRPSDAQLEHWIRPKK